VSSVTIRTVQDLLDLLTGYDPETPVLIAHQPGYPLAETLAGVAHRDDVPAELGDEDQADDVVWLVAGGHPWDRSPYAPAWVFDAAEVSR
jgi:hypothetical protein